jgi:hypothetical protein
VTKGKRQTERNNQQDATGIAKNWRLSFALLKK